MSLSIFSCANGVATTAITAASVTKSGFFMAAMSLARVFPGKCPFPGKRLFPGKLQSISYAGRKARRSEARRHGRNPSGAAGVGRVGRRRRAADSRQGADFLGSEESREEARCDRYRSDHARRRLRVGEPGHARRAMEGGFVPLLDAGFPRPRASRRDVRDRRRSLRDRQLARNVAGRPESDRRRSWSRDGDHLREQHGRHLPQELVQSRPARGAEPRRGCRCARWRRVHVRSGVSRDRQRHPGQDLYTGAAEREGRRDPAERRHLRRRAS